MKKLTYLILLLALVSYGAAPTKTTTFTSGTTIRSSEVNTNFDDLYGYLQTGVDTIRADGLDAITEIKSTIKSGADATVVTGTKGTSGYCAEWNSDGDLVEAASAAACGSSVGGGASELDGLSDVGTSTATAGNVLFADGSKFNAHGGAPTDEYCLTYEATGATLDWQECASGTGDLLADGTVPLTANWDVGNYDLTFKAATGDGTIEGATITEGGNAVYNATETPGGELGGTFASFTIDDSIAVSSWNLTTPTITTSLTTSTPTTISAAELDRLDGLAGIVVTDATACTDVEGTNLSITAGTLNVGDAFLVNDANDSTSGVLTSTGFTIGAAAIVETELETIDGVTAGTAAASKAVVLDASKDIGTLNVLTATGLVATTSLEVTALSSCDTVDTLIDGSFVCGTDDGGTITGTDTHVMFFDGADTPAGEAGFVYAKATDSATLGGRLDSTGLIASTSMQVNALASCNTIDTDASGIFSCGTDASGSGGFSFKINPQQAKLPSSNPMAIDAGEDEWKGLFDDTTDECAVWAAGIINPFGSGTWKATLAYTLETTSTSDVVELELSIMCVSDGDDLDTAAYGSVDNLSSGSVSTEDGFLNVLTDTSLNEDSCLEDDLIYVKICRDADDTDTTADDVEFRGGVIYEE